MKKLAFLNLNDKSYGGVNAVNHTLMTELIKNGYSCDAVYLRTLSEKGLPEISGAGRFLARNDSWHFTEFCEIKNELKKFRLFHAIKKIFCRITDELKYRSDTNKIRKFLIETKPDKLIVSHYLLLRAVPKEMLKNTFMHVHTSLRATIEMKKGYKTLLQYNGKINFIFLSQGIKESAEREGFCNTYYLYNPIKFSQPEKLSEKENVIAVITRFSSEKRIPEMIQSVSKVLKNHPDWKLVLYGSGPREENIKKAIEQTGCGETCGVTSAPEKILSRAKLTLNTSEYEGFSLSIIEAGAMGVPTVAFNFGEAANEEIIHGKTGIIVPMDDFSAFEFELEKLIKDPEKIEFMSKNAFEFAKNFSAKNVLRKFEEIINDSRN